jgi:hypothetical protein
MRQTLDRLQSIVDVDDDKGSSGVLCRKSERAPAYAAYGNGGSNMLQVAMEAAAVILASRER